MDAGHQVWIGARDEARGRQVADAVGARFVQHDVTDDASVTAAGETVGELDVLVNNAGISGGCINPSETTADQCCGRSTRRMCSHRAFPRMRINSVDPGFTTTDDNEHRGMQTVEEGAEPIVRYALIAGGVFDRDGAEPW